MNKQFLVEDFFSDMEILTESKNGVKSLVMKGLFQKANAKNQNGRVYPQNILEREVKKFQGAISEKRSVGELDHPEDPKIHLDRVSHMITEAKMDNNGVVYGALKLMDTPKGQIAHKLVEGGMKMGISSRGMGSLKEAEELLVVQEDFAIVTWDLVAEPSTDGAWVAPTQLSEGLIKLINDPKTWHTYQGNEFKKELDQIIKDMLK
ncbi:MAG: primosomal protein [Candidatus Heimdallarchaeaceae archaeon]